MKRRLLIIAICLLLGAVVNVAVAWGRALWAEMGWMYADQILSENALWMMPRPDRFPSRPRRAASWQTFGLRQTLIVAHTEPMEQIERLRDQIERTKSDLAQFEEQILTDLRSTTEPEPERLYRLAEWELMQDDIRDLQSLVPGESGFFHLWVIDAGWPLKSLQGGKWGGQLGRADPQSPETWTVLRGAVQIKANPVLSRYRFHSEQRLLPLAPKLAGFAINTLFYAALLWPLTCVPLALRRFLRVRRGLCPKCAYPMGESAVCTECGCGLPKRVSTT